MTENCPLLSSWVRMALSPPLKSWGPKEESMMRAYCLWGLGRAQMGLEHKILMSRVKAS